MANPVVKFVTAKGEITVELMEDYVPNTVANFIYLVERGYYNGMAFHRVIPGFMAQGGCPYSKEGAEEEGMPGTGGPGYCIADEFHEALRHDRPGVLSMANAGPDTNGSQFFLCFAPTPWLDDKHSVFGYVTEGFEVVQEIEQLGSESGEPLELVPFDVVVVSKNDHPYEPQTL
ncbi:MAG: hypothetical protein A3K19_32205 [Lentisphaerae bacterium RIFOXYB12_FULL_65_16]|nr:MAG: hypothetical protein A3K18_12725 [Lentisphaerae bacterium RIFOXYA12_64_32]OGV88764.1 MAG: hypothetical protein A3K19_32205 [Lentisphaerae bacterium RIFOXYB12_FULL_65_16]